MREREEEEGEKRKLRDILSFFGGCDLQCILTLYELFQLEKYLPLVSLKLYCVLLLYLEIKIEMYLNTVTLTLYLEPKVEVAQVGYWFEKYMVNRHLNISPCQQVM